MEWFEHETRLRTLLRSAAEQAHLSPEHQVKYIYSATHQEIIRGLHLLDDQKSKEASHHVLACVRSLNNLDRSTTSLLYDQKDQQVHHMVASKESSAVFSCMEADYSGKTVRTFRSNSLLSSNVK